MRSTVCGFEVHEAAEMFPLVHGADFDALVEDIRQNGLMEPIVLDAGGRLIDGRNRARACEELGIDPATKIYTGLDVLQFVVSHNLHRRHLTDSQRAMIAAKLATRRPGYRREILESTHSYEGVGIPPSASEAADLLGVSTSSIQKARTVSREGTPGLQALVANGRAPVTTAARVATELAPHEQDEYVAQVLAGANPVKVAPKAIDFHKPIERPPSPPKYGGNRRKHLQMIEALITGLSGYVLAFDGVDTFDSSITAEEATRLADGLSKQIGALHRIRKLLTLERTT